MRVCVDVQAAVSQRAGVGRYTKALVEHLGAGAGMDSLRVFYFDFKGKGEPLKPGGATVSTARWFPGRLAQFAWKTISWPPFDMFAGPADVFHFPNFIIPPLSRGRSVVTIHDASFLRFPEMAETRNLLFLQARIKDTVRRADAIIAVSQFCADEIVQLLGAPPGRVHVTYEGISPAFAPAAPADASESVRDLGLDRPFILTVGTIEPRKNTRFLIEVFEKMKAFDGLLAIVGMPGWKCEPIMDRMISSSRAKDIRYLRYVSDRQLRALYTRAELFMFPSLYEGFGFPPLEAMACGATVISSSAGSLPEVLGDAAVIIDGFDSNLWAETAISRLGDRSMVEKGRDQGSRVHLAENGHGHLECLQEGGGMRIAIDARWITPEASGIGVYTQELVKALALLDSRNEYVLFFNSTTLRDRTIEAAALRNSANVAPEVVPYGVFAPSSQLYLPGLLKRRGIDVFHSPNYMIPLLAFPRSGKGRIAAVVTIHDVIPMIFPDHAPKSRKTRLFPLYRQLMIEVGRRAHMIIADSESSRRDVIAHLQIPTERHGRIRTVYCGLGSRLAHVDAHRHARSGNEPRTILYVGRSDPYKNCVGLVSAFSLVRQQCPFPVRLVMAGSPDVRYPEINAKIGALGLNDAVLRRYLSDQDLATAYGDADILALPSLYEGFGLPVLEAMAFGTPVVCSNRGSLPEIAGDAAIQVDPTDIPGMAAAMTRVLTDPALAREMSEKGLRQAAGFTWQRAAGETLAVYRQAAEILGL